jgi:hypothetical protein
MEELFPVETSGKQVNMLMNSWKKCNIVTQEL